MNAAVNFDKISNVLKGDDNIVFALVFGSQANGQNQGQVNYFPKNK